MTQDPAVRERNACAKLARLPLSDVELLVGHKLTGPEWAAAQAVMRQVERAILARGNKRQRARGMVTMLSLRQGSVVNEETGCWVWQGANDGRHGVPRIRTTDWDSGDSRVMPGPRAVLNIATQRPLGPGKPTRTCGEYRCVCPGHHLMVR